MRKANVIFCRPTWIWASEAANTTTPFSALARSLTMPWMSGATPRAAHYRSRMAGIEEEQRLSRDPPQAVVDVGLGLRGPPQQSVIAA
jgi:hypothetical protein